jgi:tRNA 2-thiouridine synthesizing protein A
MDLALAYRRAKIGDIIELWATDPGVKADVRAWAAKTKNEVISIEQQGDKIVSILRIKRR